MEPSDLKRVMDWRDEIARLDREYRRYALQSHRTMTGDAAQERRRLRLQEIRDRLTKLLPVPRETL
jgi:hypothetical protein